MVKTLVLFDQIYYAPKERKKEDVYLRYLKYLNERVKGFPDTSLEIKKLREFDKRFEVSISGPEEVFMQNILKKEIGSITEFKDTTEGAIYKGNLTEVGKVGFGLFVDCAIMNPKVEVLINLHTLREQLCRGMEKSLNQIINAYDFIDHFPVHVKILKIDRDNLKAQGELAPITLELFKKILDENLEALLLSGETKGQFKKVIARKGHFRDIITVKRFGFLENMVLLKTDSNAPGIISEIGKDLENCKFSALRPQRIRRLFL
ncbi:MAG: DUF2110 family protein [Candidatus Lokiarchaeota archaeon]|nr:DUF2110 family protein [Candidatus Lokiarchaeota archaeon]